MDRKFGIVTLLGLLLTVSLGINGWQFIRNRSSSDGLKVIGVLDGDTITLEGKTRFRLRNIDAPEIENCGGEEAKKELEKLIGDKKVSVKEEILDNWGRPMGLVYIGNRLVNKEMLESGWARYHHDTTTVAGELKLTADYNKENKIGIFSQKCYQWENTINPRCNIKGNIDQNNSSIKRYCVPGCVQYKTAIVELDRGEEWFCSEDKAKKAGYVKSERCP